MIIAAIIFIILHFSVALSYSPAMWGVDSWFYFGMPLAIVFALIGLIAIFPQANRLLTKKFEVVAVRLDKIPIWTYILLMGVLFFVFSQETFFLGDGYLRIKNTNTGVLLNPEQPLDTMLHTVLLYFINKITLIDGGDVFRFVSIASGMFFVWGLILYARKLIEDKVHRWLFIKIILLQGYILFYFGYIESYSIMFTLSFLAALSSLSMLKSKKFSFFPIIFAVSSILFHPISAMYLPAVIFAYFIVIKKEKNRNAIKWISIVALIILPIVALVVGFMIAGMPFSRFQDHYGEGGRMLALFAGEDGRGIFNPDHLLEILNSLLLSVPVVIFLPFIKWKAKASNIFLWISLGLSLFFILTVNTGLGVSRDWDLYSVTAIPIVLLVSLGIVRKERSTELNHRFLIVAFFMSVIHTVPWILLNSSETMSIARAKNMIESPGWSDAHNARITDSFANYYDKTDQLDSAEVYLKLAYKYEPNPRYIFGMAYFEQKRNNYVRAIALYDSIKDKLPRKEYSINVKLAELYFITREFRKSGDHYKKALELNSKETIMYFNMGLSYMNAGYKDEAIAAFEEMHRRQPDHRDAIYNLANLYYRSDKFKESAKIFEKVRLMEPDNPAVYYNLAICYTNDGDFETGLKYANFAKEKGYDWNTINGMIRELKRLISQNDNKSRK